MLRKTVAALSAAAIAALPAAGERALAIAPGAGPHAWSIEVAPETALHAESRGDLSGEAAPVLMLSGGPGFACDQMASIADALAGDRPVIMLDQRGTGKSRTDAFDPAGFSFEQAVGDLERVRGKMGVERWTLVGHSWGGILAMAYAAEHPGRVESLVLVSPGGLEPSFLGQYQMNLMARLDADAQQKLAGLTPAEQTWDAYAAVMREANVIMAPAMLAENAGEGALEALLTNIRDESRFNPLVSMAMQHALSSYDLSQDVAKVDAPVLVVQGRDDAIGEEAVRKIESAFPNARLQFIDNAGHWPMLETPRKLNELISAFLAELNEKTDRGG